MLSELTLMLPDIPFDFNELTMPRHRGPLILILGGSAMLAVSLFLSLLLQNRHLNQGNPTHPGPQQSYPHHSLRVSGTTAPPRPTRKNPTQRPDPQRGVRPPTHRPDPRRGAQPSPGRPAPLRKSWLRSLKRASKQAGLGSPKHLVAPGGRHALELKKCRTCRYSPRHAGCENERRMLEDTLRRHLQNGRVVEVSCDARLRGRCRFEILVGDQ